MKLKSAFILVFGTIFLWLSAFLVHGYIHVKRLTGACCGYEGEPKYLALMFLIYPGVYYFVALPAVLIFALLIFAPSDKTKYR